MGNSCALDSAIGNTRKRSANYLSQMCLNAPFVDLTAGPAPDFAPPTVSTPASMVGSILLSSEVSHLLLVPTFRSKTQIEVKSA